MDLYVQESLQPEMRRVSQQLDDISKYAYIGKDGRDYYSRETLEEANKQYEANMHSKK